MNIEQFRGKVSHARVAFGPSIRYSDFSRRVPEPQVHVGHARTLTIAEAICEHLDIPLWLRINWAIGGLMQKLSPDVGQVGTDVRYHEATVLALTNELTELCSFLGTRVERVYVPEEPKPQSSSLHAHLLVVHEESRSGGWGDDPKSQWYDDAVAHWPALIVRAADYCAPHWPLGTEEFVGWEKRLYELCGHTHYEVNTPLWMVNGEKMGASALNAVSWKVLKPMGREKARTWLKQRACNSTGWIPDARFILNHPNHSEWSWQEWSEAVAQAKG